MAFDSEGNFTRLHNWEQDRLNDVGIVSDRHDEEDDNFATSLNLCFLRFFQRLQASSQGRQFLMAILLGRQQKTYREMKDLQFQI